LVFEGIPRVQVKTILTDFLTLSCEITITWVLLGLKVLILKMKALPLKKTISL